MNKVASTQKQEDSFDQPWEKLILDVVFKVIRDTQLEYWGDPITKRQMLEPAMQHFEILKRMCVIIQRCLQKLAEHMYDEEQRYRDL